MRFTRHRQPRHRQPRHRQPTRCADSSSPPSTSRPRSRATARTRRASSARASGRRARRPLVLQSHPAHGRLGLLAPPERRRRRAARRARLRVQLVAGLRRAGRRRARGGRGGPADAAAARPARRGRHVRARAPERAARACGIARYAVAAGCARRLAWALAERRARRALLLAARAERDRGGRAACAQPAPFCPAGVTPNAHHCRAWEGARRGRARARGSRPRGVAHRGRRRARERPLARVDARAWLAAAFPLRGVARRTRAARGPRRARRSMAGRPPPPSLGGAPPTCAPRAPLAEQARGARAAGVVRAITERLARVHVPLPRRRPSCRGRARTTRTRASFGSSAADGASRTRASSAHARARRSDGSRRLSPPPRGSGLPEPEGAARAREADAAAARRGRPRPRCARPSASTSRVIAKTRTSVPPRGTCGPSTPICTRAPRETSSSSSAACTRSRRGARAPAARVGARALGAAARTRPRAPPHPSEVAMRRRRSTRPRTPLICRDGSAPRPRHVARRPCRHHASSLSAAMRHPGPETRQSTPRKPEPHFSSLRACSPRRIRLDSPKGCGATLIARENGASSGSGIVFSCFAGRGGRSCQWALTASELATYPRQRNPRAASPSARESPTRRGGGSHRARVHFQRLVPPAPESLHVLGRARTSSVGDARAEGRSRSWRALSTAPQRYLAEIARNRRSAATPSTSSARARLRPSRRDVTTPPLRRPPRTADAAGARAAPSSSGSGAAALFRGNPGTPSPRLVGVVSGRARRKARAPSSTLAAVSGQNWPSHNSIRSLPESAGVYAPFCRKASMSSSTDVAAAAAAAARGGGGSSGGTHGGVDARLPPAPSAELSRVGGGARGECSILPERLDIVTLGAAALGPAAAATPPHARRRSRAMRPPARLPPSCPQRKRQSAPQKPGSAGTFRHRRAPCAAAFGPGTAASAAARAAAASTGASAGAPSAELSAV